MISANLHNVATVIAEESEGVSWLRLRAEDGSHVCIFMPMNCAIAMQDAFTGATAAANAAMVAFIEEVRDFRPDVISGRAHDPQDDLDDMMLVDQFYALQEDAEQIIGPKPKKEVA